MEQYILDSIERNVYDAYTCAVEDYPYLACLDIAGPSTLAGTVNVSRQIGSEDDLLQVTAHVYYTGNSDVLFGNDQRCDGRVVGDGVVSVLDMSVLMWVFFRVPPYETATSTTLTVDGQVNVGDRCEDNITRNDFLLAYDLERPCLVPTNLPLPVPRSALVESDFLHTSIHLHRRLAGGSWFHIHNQDTLIAFEFVLAGVDSLNEVPLSNLRAPWREGDLAQPFDARRVEVRHARHVEYIGRAGLDRCAPIQGLVASSAMYRETIGVGQVPTIVVADQSYLCGFDVFLYLPDVFDCSVSIRGGSRAIDGISGREGHDGIPCDPTPFNFDRYHLGGVPAHQPPPALPWPPSHPSPLSPPRASAEDRTLFYALVAVAAAAGICGCGCCLLIVCAYRRRRTMTTAHRRPSIVTTSSTTTKRVLIAPCSPQATTSRPSALPPRPLAATYRMDAVARARVAAKSRQRQMRR